MGWQRETEPHLRDAGKKPREGKGAGRGRGPETQSEVQSAQPGAVA